MTSQSNRYLKPFWVFCYDYILYRPQGGLDDVSKTFDTYEEAFEYASNVVGYDRVEIFQASLGAREIIR